MQYNIKPGTFETINDLSIGTFVLNVVTNFKIDGNYEFLLSDIVVKQGVTVISASNYTLSIDTAATTQESGQTAKTLYGAIKITNVTYTGVELNVSGSNFGTYTSNQATVDALAEGLLTKTEATGSNIQAGEIARFVGTGQNIESDNSGAVVLWDAGTIFNTAGTLARLDGDTFTATGKTVNQGFDPTSPNNVLYWYEAEDEKLLKKLAKDGDVCGGKMHTVHDRSGANYAQNLLIGKKKINGVTYNFHMVHLDGTVVTGNATLENIFNVGGGGSEYQYLDLFAPDVVGTRTLVDMASTHLAPISVGGENDVLAQWLENRSQGHAHGTFYYDSTTPFTGNRPLKTTGSDGAISVISSQVNDDGVNGTPRTGLTTRPNEFTVGASYIIVQVPA